jgi:hypothetical protein
MLTLETTMATTITVEQQTTAHGPNRELASESEEQYSVRRPARRRLTAEETRERVKAFAAEREEALVAAVREDED